MKVIMPVGDLPPGAVITKVGGTHKFTLSDTFTIYYPGSESRVIKSDKDCMFLIPATFTSSIAVNAIGIKTEVMWNVSDSELYEYLTNKMEEDED